jgi:branched-chain amino acid transport system ATP-binding protein
MGMSLLPVLEMRRVSFTWPGAARPTLHDCTFELAPGEGVALLGRNGAGKTTLLRSIMGLHRELSGSISYDGKPIEKWSPNARARAGIGWVPDDRGIYASLTVAENLTLPPIVHKDAWTMEQIHATFPRLRERRSSMGTQLSGGEQQMLAMGRALMARPKLLLLDEPSMGLAPIFVEKIFEIIKEINEQGTPILLVEQNALMALDVASRGYVLETGKIALADDAKALRQNEQVRKTYLGEE